MKNKNINVISGNLMILVTIVLLFCFIFGYFLQNMIYSNNDVVSKNTGNEVEVKYYLSNLAKVDLESQEKNFTFLIDEKDINIKVNNLKACGTSFCNNIYLNDKKLKNSENFSYANSLQVFNNYILVIYKDINNSYGSIYLYDINGNKINSLKYENYEEIKIENDTITISYSTDYYGNFDKYNFTYKLVNGKLSYLDKEKICSTDGIISNLSPLELLK